MSYEIKCGLYDFESLSFLDISLVEVLELNGY